jgi:HK97 gp10 family phage protein
MAVTVRVDGLRELKAALEELPKSTARGVQQRVLLKRAQLIVTSAKAKAPVEHGDLRDSIHATTKRPRGHKTPAARAFAQTMATGGSIAQAKAASKAAGAAPVEVFVGPGRMPQASLQEFGTRHHGPHPYLRPAWDENKAKMLDGIGKDMWEEIRKTAERAARRQAKRASR